MVTELTDDVAPASASDRGGLIAAPTSSRRRHPLLFRLWAIGVVAFVLVASTVWVQSRLSRNERELTTLRARVTTAATQISELQRRLAAAESQIKGEEDRQGALPRVAAAVAASVFTIDVADGSGTGWVVASSDQTSELVTAYHVVSSVGLLGAVTVRNADRAMVGRVEALNAAHDLALVSVENKLTPLLVRQALPSVGEQVFVAGSPMGLSGTVTSGVVSSLRSEAGETYIQISAAVSPGSSGSPVLDVNGKVIGVALLKLVEEGVEGLSFAAPGKVVCSALELTACEP